MKISPLSCPGLQFWAEKSGAQKCIKNAMEVFISGSIMAFTITKSFPTKAHTAPDNNK